MTKNNMLNFIKNIKKKKTNSLTKKKKTYKDEDLLSVVAVGLHLSPHTHSLFLQKKTPFLFGAARLRNKRQKMTPLPSLPFFFFYLFSIPS
jgi:hypothetical protein